MDMEVGNPGGPFITRVDKNSTKIFFLPTMERRRASDEKEEAEEQGR